MKLNLSLPLLNKKIVLFFVLKKGMKCTITELSISFKISRQFIDILNQATKAEFLIVSK